MKKDFRQALNLRVLHDESASKFFLPLGAEEISVTYTCLNDHLWQIDQVQVPSHLRSMNVHAQVLEYVLELALQEKIQIIPACAYAQSFMKLYQRFQVLIPANLSEIESR